MISTIVDAGGALDMPTPNRAATWGRGGPASPASTTHTRHNAHTTHEGRPSHFPSHAGSLLQPVCVHPEDASSSAAARTIDDLWDAIAIGIDTFTPTECENYFAAAGYDRE